MVGQLTANHKGVLLVLIVCHTANLSKNVVFWVIVQKTPIKTVVSVGIFVFFLFQWYGITAQSVIETDAMRRTVVFIRTLFVPNTSPPSHSNGLAV